jgi:hypothetical protein
MAKRTTAPTGAPCWVDLMTPDTGRSRAFYGEVFGWQANEPSEQYGGYFTFTKDGVEVAGCMGDEPGSGNPTLWTVYLATDDAAKTLEAAAAAGATISFPAQPVGDLGTMSHVTDPTGAGVGLWQPGTFTGFGTYAEDSTPGWFELHTRDYQAAVSFYRDVFGWQTQVMGDTPDFRYTVLQHGEEQLAGIMDAAAFLPEGTPARWSVYFAVEDADATLATVTRLGGSVVLPAEDTPYGRLATAADPMGAQFKLVAPNEAMPARPA